MAHSESRIRRICQGSGPPTLQAYENLAMLEGTSGMVQEAFQASIQTGSKLLQKDSQNLGAYFNKVSQQCSISLGYPTENVILEGTESGILGLKMA